VALHWRGEDGSERAITYAELLTDVQRLANALKDLGVQPGDVVGIYLPMIPEVVVAMQACARIGAVALLAAVLAFGICCESVAGAGERSSSPSGQAAARSQRLEATPSASSQHQAELGSMRYYGGPKSPAWRAPAVN